ncbi:MAG: zinc-dependent metalloprotease [Candidatus Nanopelagicales bacterium]
MGEATAIDWGYARTVAKQVAGNGPQIPLREAKAAVADLRRAAQVAVPLIADRTGLHAPAAPGAVEVVDRAGWTEANALAFRFLLDPLTERMSARNASRRTGVGAVGSRVAGAEIGAALGFLSSKVLGQYELFTASADVPPRLLLVAPNIVHVERQMDVDPSDFRLWVCLHEETHRVQFTAVPWLGPWLRGQIDGYLQNLDLDGGQLAQRLKQLGSALIGALRGVDVVTVLEQSMSSDERDLLARLTGVMSLLEGHADVMMDEVGPDVLPSVATLRKRMQQRRNKPRGTDAVMRRLLGMESKMAQYRDGAAFVRAAIAEAGLDGFNRVWESPETLPTRDELHDPSSWLRRMDGPGT